MSSYLRNAALNRPINSTADQQAFLGLLKVNADPGRLGGLLKLSAQHNARTQRPDNRRPPFAARY